MSIWEHWQVQKKLLRPKLAEQPDMAGVAFQVRHALAQTEQYALAELEDDVLRQQAGVLLGALKTSVGLLETPIAAQTWTVQRQNEGSRENRLLRQIAFGLLLALVLWCGWKKLWLGAAIGACSLILSAVSHFTRPKAANDEMRVSLKPDIDRLLILLDGQLRAAERALNDFTYLNDQLRSGNGGADSSSAARAADLMEALYACESEARAEAEEAAERLLGCLGLRAVAYSEENSRYFSTLPSKQITRTLSPAILSVQEHRLIRRGTAAVRTDAA